MKVQKAMTIDHEVYVEFQKLFPNQASSFCNEQMRLRVASAKGDLSGINLQLLKVKERELQELADAHNTELITIREQISQATKLIQDQEKQKLQEAKAEAEAIKKCDGCGFKMQESKIEAGGEKFCTECWHNENPKMLEAFKRDEK